MKSITSWKKITYLLLLCFILLMSACSIEVPNTTDLAENNLEVHFIDVGQADAILIKAPNDENIMIDGGNNGDSEEVVEYIRRQGVNKLKAVIGTHPHEDHIGGLDGVIESFGVEAVYMPKVVHTTKTFEDLLKAIKSKGLKITPAEKGVRIPLEGYEAVFLGPVSPEYEELNNYSAVLKVTFGNNTFLFQGDAEDLAEGEIINSYSEQDLKADVIKLGHHGSSTSSSKGYIEKVEPIYAVVMAGKDNDYGHPHKETMELLKEKNIKIYRTDTQETIVAISDGDKIRFNVSPSSDYSYGTKNKEEKQDNIGDEKSNRIEEKGLIKGNINSKGEKIYHLPGGAYYEGTIPEQWFKTEEEAQAAGFRKASK